MISISYHALKIMDILAPISSFVHARRRETGGFAATPRLPSTIEDTYHAVNIFESLNKLEHYGVPSVQDAYEARNDSALSRYLSMPFYMLPDVKTVFQLLKSRRLVGLEIDIDAVRAYMLSQVNSPFSLQRRYYLGRIANEILGDGPLSVPVFLRGCRRLRWRTVNEAWMCLFLVRAGCVISPFDEKGLAQWFQDCQNGDGGFGFLPQTTSYIENCHICLRALAILGATPQNMDAALDFIIGCHTGAGGFSRNGMAAPFLDATWHAVASLSLLCWMHLRNFRGELNHE